MNNLVKDYIDYTINNQYTINKTFSSNLVTIKKSDDVFNYCKDMGKLDKEHLRGLYLDSKNNIIHDEIISIGTINSSIAVTRDIIRPAILKNAVGMILIHNHPSGDLTPSIADRKVNESVKGACELMSVSFLDNIIISKDDYISYLN